MEVEAKLVLRDLLEAVLVQVFNSLLYTCKVEVTAVTTNYSGLGAEAGTWQPAVATKCGYQTSFQVISLANFHKCFYFSNSEFVNMPSKHNFQSAVLEPGDSTGVIR